MAFRGEPWVDTERGILVPPQHRGIGLVFQSYAVWPHLSVFDNVAYPLRNQKLAAADIRRRVHKTLRSVGLDGLAERATHQLSGGQQQRVAMARALVGEPGLLLLDEPFSNLDVGLRHKLRLELKDLQRELGLTVVLVTHDQEDAFALSDRIALLEAGRVAQIGTAEQLHDQPRSAYVYDFIGKSSALHAVAQAAVPGGLPRAAVADASVALSPDGEHFAPGSELVLRVRPQDVRLSAQGEGLWGEVSHTIFAGSRYETHVRLADGQQLMAYQPRDAYWKAGQRIHIDILAAPYASAAATPSAQRP